MGLVECRHSVTPSVSLFILCFWGYLFEAVCVDEQTGSIKTPAPYDTRTRVLFKTQGRGSSRDPRPRPAPTPTHPGGESGYPPLPVGGSRENNPQKWDLVGIFSNQPLAPIADEKLLSEKFERDEPAVPVPFAPLAIFGPPWIPRHSIRDFDFTQIISANWQCCTTQD